QLTKKQISSYKQRTAKLNKEIVRLKKKLPTVKAKQQRVNIIDTIDRYNLEIKQINKKLYPKPTRLASEEVSQVSSEVSPEELEALQVAEAGKLARPILRYEAGLVGGVFGGTTAGLLEIGVPLKFIVGPATTSLRLLAGLAQNQATDKRFSPVCLDLVLNYPPGFLSGVENYIGGGINYLVSTSDGRAGTTLGGQLFYGVQSDGFDGLVFGELGFAIFRPGYAASYKGTTVMIGYKRDLGSR
ncbi:MAG: hypothetical protein PHH14_06590, partial [Candidatus Margulisbacteria bacterium]|nr:hypothetical protein [Candidatus Margulisiibacteriota bacterium]